MWVGALPLGCTCTWTVPPRKSDPCRSGRGIVGKLPIPAVHAEVLQHLRRLHDIIQQQATGP